MYSKKIKKCYLLLALLLCFGCKKESSLPILETKVADVFGTNATSGGMIITRTSASIKELGVCWSTNKNPSINDARTLDIFYSSVYISIMEGLTPGTEYYYRAYANSSDGVAYGNTLKLKTKADNSSFLQTDSIKFLTLRTVRAYASLKYPGDFDQIQRKGFCYAGEPVPTISNTVVDNDDYPSTVFKSNLSFETGNTIYIRPFLELKNGNVYYGEPVSVKPGRIEITAVDRLTFRSARVVIENDEHPSIYGVRLFWGEDTENLESDAFFMNRYATSHYTAAWNLKPNTTYFFRPRMSSYFPDPHFNVFITDWVDMQSFVTLPLPDIGNGIYEDPYSIDGALYHTSFPGHVWIKGYIVGDYSSNSGGNFNPPFNILDNILIAGDAEELFRHNAIQANLPQGPIREALNLKENPGNKGAKLKIHGKVYNATHAVVMTEIQGFELE